MDENRQSSRKRHWSIKFTGTLLLWAKGISALYTDLLEHFIETNVPYKSAAYMKLLQCNNGSPKVLFTNLVLQWCTYYTSALLFPLWMSQYMCCLQIYYIVLLPSNTNLNLTLHFSKNCYFSHFLKIKIFTLQKHKCSKPHPVWCDRERGMLSKITSLLPCV